MENEQKEVDLKNNEEVSEEEVENEGDDVKEEVVVKKQFTPEQKLARINRMKAKLEKELGIEAKTNSKSESQSEHKPEQTKSSELDFGQKAYLKAYGISGADELALVKTWLTRTGDTLDTLVVDDVFTAKLGQLREAKASQQAVPKGTGRTTTTPKDSVDFHLEKYESGQMKLSEMPFEIRKQVLEKAVAKKEAASKFAFHN